MGFPPESPRKSEICSIKLNYTTNLLNFNRTESARRGIYRMVTICHGDSAWLPFQARSFMEGSRKSAWRIRFRVFAKSTLSIRFLSACPDKSREPSGGCSWPPRAGRGVRRFSRGLPSQTRPSRRRVLRALQAPPARPGGRGAQALRYRPSRLRVRDGRARV